MINNVANAPANAAGSIKQSEIDQSAATQQPTSDKAPPADKASASNPSTIVSLGNQPVESPVYTRQSLATPPDGGSNIIGGIKKPPPDQSADIIGGPKQPPPGAASTSAERLSTPPEAGDISTIIGGIKKPPPD